jgi:hypothetical protein
MSNVVANLLTLSLQKYLDTVDLPNVLQELGAQNINLHIEKIRYFTEKEAEKRGKIVQGYFSENGVKQIVNAIVTLTSPPKLKISSLILDIGTVAD